MLNLARVVNNPLLAQPFAIQRTTGKFVAGGWQGTTVDVPAYGVIVPADDEALNMVAEGDRVTGSMQVLTENPIYETRDDLGATSDRVVWRGQTYRVVAVGPWMDFGFYSAIIVRVSGK